MLHTHEISLLSLVFENNNSKNYIDSFYLYLMTTILPMHPRVETFFLIVGAEKEVRLSKLQKCHKNTLLLQAHTKKKI